MTEKLKWSRDLSPMSFAHGFGRHVAMRRYDWPEVFGMVRTKALVQRYQTTLSAAILLADVVGR